MARVKLGRARGLGAALAVACALLLGGSTMAAPAAPEAAGPVTPMSVAPGTLPQGVDLAAIPPYVAGTRWLVVNSWDALQLSGGTATVSSPTATGNITFVSSSPAGSLIVPLNVPYGARVFQVDAYGYRKTAGNLTWRLMDHDVTTGVYTPLTPVTTSGTGLHHTSADLLGAQVLNGHTLNIQVSPTDGSAGFVGAIVQYTQPLTNVLVPITPVRVYDSRCAGMGGRLVAATPRTLNVKNAHNTSTCAVTVSNAIPEGAVAVAYNLTVTDTAGAGYVAILPGTSTTVTASAINWKAAHQDIANGGVVQLGTGAHERQVTLVLNGSGGPSTHVILDITGYYVSES